MIVKEILKCDSQWPNLIHAFAMEIIFLKHVLPLRTILRCLHDSLLGPGVDVLLHLSKELVNSSSVNQAQDKNE